MALNEKDIKQPITKENTQHYKKPEKTEDKFTGEMAIVIDDVGYSLKELKLFLQFPHALSFSVLPRLSYSREAAKLIRQAGKDILLHQPMEALDNKETGPGTIYTNMSYPEIEEILKVNISYVPGALGINNHMGSKVTADESVMSMIMYFLRKKEIFFLDSMTTAGSVCMSVAKEMGVSFSRRDIFIDIQPDKDIIRKQIIKGMDIACKNHSAVLIGHIQNEIVLDVLYDMLPDIGSKRVKIVGISDVIKNQRNIR